MTPNLLLNLLRKGTSIETHKSASSAEFADQTKLPLVLPWYLTLNALLLEDE